MLLTEGNPLDENAEGRSQTLQNGSDRGTDVPEEDGAPSVEFRKTLGYFIVIFLLIGSILAGTIGTLFNLESKDYLDRLAITEAANVDIGVNMISTKLEAVISDLLFLSRQNELRQLVEEDGDAAGVKARISREYLAFSREKRLYDAIRFIDASGMEAVRVNFNGGRPSIVAGSDLTSTAAASYFRDTIALGPNEIFVSSFDLAVENETIETPLQPVIRFAIPVFDRDNHRRGVVVLNYLGDELIDAIRESARLSRGTMMLVNGDGYWLCSPHPEDEWGFRIPGRNDRKFSFRYPEAWRTIAASDRCQIHGPDGLFTAATVYPLKKRAAFRAGSSRAYGDSILSVRQDEYYWKIISHVPAADLATDTQGLMTKLGLMAIYLFLLAAIPSWFLSQTLVRRKMYQNALYRSAHYDRLTKLPNRALFLDRLDRVIRDARRHGRRFALMFIDLDGFKTVNDTLGHGSGDALLVEASDRLLKCLRESDTVARMGGDEFTVILPAVETPAGAQRVARKIIEALEAPFSVDGHAPKIGASIGISLYPHDGKDLDVLLKKADDAMYQAKKEGKNDYRFSSGAR